VIEGADSLAARCAWQSSVGPQANAAMERSKENASRILFAAKR
jgi:hypothetical protein